jgi:hypothetical protein
MVKTATATTASSHLIQFEIKQEREIWMQLYYQPRNCSASASPAITNKLLKAKSEDVLPLMWR